jgi:hypothetical protein
LPLKLRRPVLVGCIIIVLAALTVLMQFEVLRYEQQGGFMEWEIRQHEFIMKMQGGIPWQYRILPELIVEGCRRLGLSAVLTYVSLRTLQNLAIFLLAYLFYRKLGLTLPQSILGLGLAASAMFHSLYNAVVGLSSYFEAIFLLGAILAVMERRLWLAVVMTAIGSLCRETMVIVPLFLIVYTWPSTNRRDRIPAFASAAVCLAIAVGLFLLFPHQSLARDFATTPPPGIALNRRAPRLLRVLFWTIVPAMFAAHWFLGVMAEMRHMLGAVVVVVIPMAIFGLRSASDDKSRNDKGSPARAEAARAT